MTVDHGMAELIVTDLTADQVAMVELLGGDVRERRLSQKYLENTPAGLLSLDPAIKPHVIRQYLCPVVEYRGRLRMVLPDGDVRTVNKGEA